MKNTHLFGNTVCPRCGKIFNGVPALSRKDNETMICPDCGTREALESIGVSKGEQDAILETIHQCEQKAM
jgi:glutaredoxin-related protein